MIKETNRNQVIQEKLIEDVAVKNNFEDNYKIISQCPYCKGKLIKRGKRKKKYEEVQIYYCEKCDKRLTSQITKGKTYPLRIIIDSLSLYNRLHSYEEISELINGKYGILVTRQIISKWIEEYREYTSFLRMREFASKRYSKKDLIEEVRLIHQQIYDFKYHRAKLDMILSEDFKHYRFRNLNEFLELVAAECPHQIFRNKTKRASEFKDLFNLDEVKIIPKINLAVKTAGFVIQGVSNNKLRHEVLQDFMLSNDSVTVAVEVAILLNADDIKHYRHNLGFDVPIDLEDEEYLTGHIDLIQVRNGSIYIMDYKPSAKKVKPIEQLTIYALALARLTGIRLYHFKCAWFDDRNYYEFFPLHVVYKKKKKMKKLPRDQKRIF
ncbi:MAG: PD-(D/E)XK nuclease family protein [archaeon]